MIDPVQVLSNLVAALAFAIIVFLFTNSKIGIKIMTNITDRINVTSKERKKEKRYMSEIETEDGKVKKVSSKLYEQPKKFDVNTFFTINSTDLDYFDIIRFSIKDKIDHKNTYFDINTDFLKKHVPSEYIEDDTNKKIQVYIRRLKGKEDFTIERLGRAIDPVVVSNYKKVN